MEVESESLRRRGIIATTAAALRALVRAIRREVADLAAVEALAAVLAPAVAELGALDPLEVPLPDSCSGNCE